MARYRRLVYVFVLFWVAWATHLTASASDFYLDLSEREHQWLQQNPTVSFTGDPNWLPFEAFDNEGQYIGIVSEHLKLISALTGIKFEMSPSGTWTESTEKAKKGLVG